MNVFERRESKVRSYCRMFDKVFTKAEGATLVTEDGREYIDFFAGAGTLNYGHNHPLMRQCLIDYLEDGGIIHSLDMFTSAKRAFLEGFEQVILKPRGLDYKVMVPGPTGTNAVEAALKLARKVKGRTTVISFTNGYHGMTLGSLAATGNLSKRNGAGIPLNHVVHMPFDGYLGEEIDSLEVLRRFLLGASSGMDLPAAIILETVQGEGGVNVASTSWLQELAAITAQHDILLIVDDIQAGCGRTGSFFSFEESGIVPDIVTLSKSLSGFGLPFALTLFKPEWDIWQPGEHNGTFRGNNAAFVTATAALDFWRDDRLQRQVREKGERVRRRLSRIAAQHTRPDPVVRGRGLFWGLAFGDSDLAAKVSRRAFENGLVIETAGARDQVLKLLPPLTIETEQLDAGLDIIEASLGELLQAGTRRQAALADA